MDEKEKPAVRILYLGGVSGEILSEKLLRKSNGKFWIPRNFLDVREKRYFFKSPDMDRYNRRRDCARF